MAGFVRFGKEVWCCPLKQHGFLYRAVPFSLSPPASKGGAQILSQALSTAAQGNKEMLYKSSQGREDQLMPCFDNETADDYRD